MPVVMSSSMPVVMMSRLSAYNNVMPQCQCLTNNNASCEASIGRPVVPIIVLNILILNEIYCCLGYIIIFLFIKFYYY